MINTFITVAALLVSAAVVYAVLRLVRRLRRHTGPLVATRHGQINTAAVVAILTGVVSVNLAVATQHGQQSVPLAYAVGWNVLVFGGLLVLATSGAIDRRIQEYLDEKSLAAAGQPVPPRVRKPSVFGAVGLAFLWGLPGIIVISLISTLSVTASGSTVTGTESYAQIQPFLFGYLGLVTAGVALRYFIKDRRYTHAWRIYNLQVSARA